MGAYGICRIAPHRSRIIISVLIIILLIKCRIPAAASMSSEVSTESARAPLNRGMMTVSIMLATLIQTLDSTIANVALPHMQGSLSASQDEITWVLTSYIVAAAIATPLTGWLRGRFNQKKEFLASVAGFTIAS